MLTKMTLCIMTMVTLLNFGCMPSGYWYEPDDWFKPTSYIDLLRITPAESTRYYYDWFFFSQNNYVPSSVAMEESDVEDQHSYWAIGQAVPFRLSNDEALGALLLPISNSLFVQSSGSSANVVWINRWDGPDYYIVYAASNVMLIKDGDYVRGSFEVKGKAYTIQDCSLVPYDTSEEYPLQKFYFQLKINPLPENHDEILSTAKEEFGEIVDLILQKLNE